MPISFACPTCGKKLKAPDERAGRPGACPACKAPFTIPQPQPQAIPPVPPPPSVVEVPSFEFEAQAPPPRYAPAPVLQAPPNYAAPPPPLPGTFRCPFCQTTAPPRVKSEISTAGWVMFVVLLLFCLPLFWIGLLMTEPRRSCSQCGIKLG